MKKLAGVLMLMAAGAGSAAEQADPSGAKQTAIAYWTAGYAGVELSGAGCPAPNVTDAPQSDMADRDTAGAIRRWQQCHRRLIGALRPEVAERYIPAGVLAAMTPAERKAAKRHVAAVHAKLADSAQADAAPIIARHDAWREAIKRYEFDTYKSGRAIAEMRSSQADRDTAARQHQIAIYR